MRKTLLMFVLTLPALISLASCTNEGPSATDDNKTTVPTTDDKVSSDTAEEAEDFSIKTSDNGLTVSDSEFTFAVAETGDKYPPEAVISMTTDSSWNSCTGLNDNYTRIVAEDETVLPEESVEMNIVRNSDIHGSSGSNEIEGIELILDRTKIQPGDSKLKLQVRPYNGSSSIAKTTTICVEVHVKEFGTIEVDTYSVDFTVDVSGLQDILDEKGGTYTSATLHVNDSEEIYGYSADDSFSEEIDLEQIPKTIEFEMKYAVGHEYSAYVFVEADKASNRVWISLAPSGTEDGYSLEPNEDKTESTLTVTKDNVHIEATLDA